MGWFRAEINGLEISQACFISDSEMVRTKISGLEISQGCFISDSGMVRTKISGLKPWVFYIR